MSQRIITIRVTQEDIDRGGVSDPFGCPIARAAERVLGVGVTSTYVGIKVGPPPHHGNDHRARFMLSKRALRFMRRFDNGKAVEPITFRLMRP